MVVVVPEVTEKAMALHGLTVGVNCFDGSEFIQTTFPQIFLDIQQIWG